MAGGDAESKAHSFNDCVFTSTQHDPEPLTAPCFFFLNTQISTSSGFWVFSHLRSPHCLPSPSGQGKMKRISFSVIVWSVDLCVRVFVCALPSWEVDRFPPRPWPLNRAERWRLFFNLVITMLLRSN